MLRRAHRWGRHILQLVHPCVDIADRLVQGAKQKILSVHRGGGMRAKEKEKKNPTTTNSIVITDEAKRNHVPPSGMSRASSMVRAHG